MAVWTSWLLFVTLVVWTAAGGSGGPGGATIILANAFKYVIYSLLPGLAAAYYLSFGAARLRIDHQALAALALYSAIALTGISVNASDEFYAVRDLLIVSSYLLLFVFWFRAPASIVDVGLAALVFCLAIEAVTRIGSGLMLVDANGLYAILGLTIPAGNTVFGPHGILESTLGFPLGVIFLFYFHKRRWRLTAVAALLQLLAFKRISFAGVAIALAFDWAVSGKVAFVTAKRFGLVIALGLSVMTMFSTSIFQGASDLLHLHGSSANGISLGRYEIAVTLWSRLNEASALNWLVGFGPGAADALSEATADLNPHNDWLKILFDYGLLGLAVVHAILFLILVRHRIGLMVYLYTTTLMTTDNVFIYFYYYPFIAMVMCVERD